GRQRQAGRLLIVLLGMLQPAQGTADRTCSFHFQRLRIAPGGVPQKDARIVAAAGQQGVVLRKGQAANGAVVNTKPAANLARRQLPDVDRLWPCTDDAGCSRQSPPVRGKGKTGNARSLEPTDLRACSHIPQGNTITESGGQPLAVWGIGQELNS